MTYNYCATTMQPQRLKEMPYKESPWKEHYPELVGMLEDEPHIPKYNRVARNICVGGKWDEISSQARPHVTFLDNLVNVEPLFVDAKAMDFRMKPESPAWKVGFKPIPIERIGLYQDELRASWPVRHEPLPDQTLPPPERIDPPRR